MSGRYVTDRGVATVPHPTSPGLAAWHAATQLGLSLGNCGYRRPDGSWAYVVQDRCDTDRTTLGLGPREMRCSEIENVWQAMADDPEKGWGFAAIVQRASTGARAA